MGVWWGGVWSIIEATQQTIVSVVSLSRLTEELRVAKLEKDQLTTELRSANAVVSTHLIFMAQRYHPNSANLLRAEMPHWRRIESDLRLKVWTI